MKYNRIFVIVLDSLGIGAMPNARLYGDEGCDFRFRIWRKWG